MRTIFRVVMSTALAIALTSVAGCSGSSGAPGTEGLHSTVPELAGMAQAEAEKAIDKAGYKLGAVTTQTAESAQEGDVLSQQPAAGTSLARGGKVDLVIVGAPAAAAKVKVPDGVGFTIAQVRMLMGESGLVSDIRDFSGDPNVVKIKRQEPAPGTEVDEGSTVILWAK